jgi:hypothetical protein
MSSPEAGDSDCGNSTLIATSTVLKANGAGSKVPETNDGSSAVPETNNGGYTVPGTPAAPLFLDVMAAAKELLYYIEGP